MNHQTYSRSLHLYIMIFVVLVFSSCQKHVHKKQDIDIGIQLEIEKLQESIARLADIPDVPLSATIKKIVYSNEDPDQLQIFCDVVSMGRAELCSYYTAEMERLGWSLQGSYEDENAEGLLVFVKPSGALCVILLQNLQHMLITKLKKKDL